MMGRQNRNSTSGIIDYTPDNDKNTLYIEMTFGLSFSEIITHIRKHFGGDCSLDDFLINCRHIHTRAITYDLHDPTDYDDYLEISRAI